MQYKDIEIRLFIRPSKLLGNLSHIFLQLLHCVLQSSPGIINLIHNEDVFADQVSSVDRWKIKPLCPSNFLAQNFLWTSAREFFI